MHPQDDLLLIKEQLERLTEMTYFDNALRHYSSDVIRLIDHLVEKIDHMPREIVAKVHRNIWVAHQHLSGSISRETPYEVVFALTCALRDWDNQADLIVTTALIDEPNFFFSSSINWKFIGELFPDFRQPQRNITLVQISMPRIYKARPLNCIPLYHELAHHVDQSYNIVESALLVSGLASTESEKKLHLPFMRENFADLFSACYCGQACLEGLENFSRLGEVNRTHPPMLERKAVVDSFLRGENMQIVNDFNVVLQQRGLPNLKTRFQTVEIASSFDDMRPHRIATTEELHGIFSAGSSYLESSLTHRQGPWTDMRREDVTRTVNDLIEKSIRNMNVWSRWNHAAVGQGRDSPQPSIDEHRIAVAGAAS